MKISMSTTRKMFYHNSELSVEADFVLCEFLGGERNQTKFVYLCIVPEKRSDIPIMGPQIN